MMIKRAACVAFTAACLTGIATLPAANAQPAYGTAPNAYGTTPGIAGGTHGTVAPGNYGTATGTYGATSGTYNTAPGTYGATQPYPSYPAPSSAGTSNTQVLTNGPQGSPPPNWSAAQNVRESEHYDRLLERNRAFREARLRKECGPITDPQLHQQCIDSFAQYEPYAGTAPSYGSSSATRGYRSGYGR